MSALIFDAKLGGVSFDESGAPVLMLHIPAFGDVVSYRLAPGDAGMLVASGEALWLRGAQADAPDAGFCTEKAGAVGAFDLPNAAGAITLDAQIRPCLLEITALAGVGQAPPLRFTLCRCEAGKRLLEILPGLGATGCNPSTSPVLLNFAGDP